MADKKDEKKEVKNTEAKAEVKNPEKVRAQEEAAELKSRGDVEQQHPDMTPPTLGQ